jgi:hypothetical protein
LCQEQFFENVLCGLFFETQQPSKKEGNQNRKFKKAQTNTTLNTHVSDSLLLITYNEEGKEDKEEDGEDEKKKRIIIIIE